MDSNDLQFYNQRAKEIRDAVNSGNPTAAADLIAHLITEEGAEGVKQVTDAVERDKR